MAPLSQLLRNVETVVVETVDVHVSIGSYTLPATVRGWVMENEQWLRDWLSRGSNRAVHITFEYAPIITWTRH
jgi:hypothetical protein